MDLEVSAQDLGLVVVGHLSNRSTKAPTLQLGQVSSRIRLNVRQVQLDFQYFSVHEVLTPHQSVGCRRREGRLMI